MSNPIFIEIPMLEPEFQENQDYNSIVRKLKFESEREKALLKQKLELKQSELIEMHDKYNENKKLYGKPLIYLIYCE
jgi:hypothetical protein